MCGIEDFTDHQQEAPILLEGLSRVVCVHNGIIESYQDMICELQTLPEKVSRVLEDTVSFIVYIPRTDEHLYIYFMTITTIMSDINKQLPKRSIKNG